MTHDQEEALSLADRVGVMHRGVLEQVGPPEEVYRAPATRFVASFVGEGTLLEGSLVSAGNGLAVVQAGPLRLEVPRPPGAAPLQPGPVWVCVRPEAVQLGAGVRVVKVQTMGSSACQVGGSLRSPTLVAAQNVHGAAIALQCA